MKKKFNIISHQRKQIKSVRRYHCTHIRMAKIKNINHTKYWWGCRSRIPIDCSWECKVVQSLQKTSFPVTYRITICLVCDPIIPSLDIYPREIYSYNDVYTNDHNSIHNNLHWKQLKYLSGSKKINKLCYMYSVE